MTSRDISNNQIHKIFSIIIIKNNFYIMQVENPYNTFIERKKSSSHYCDDDIKQEILFDFKSDIFNQKIN